MRRVPVKHLLLWIAALAALLAPRPAWAREGFYAGAGAQVNGKPSGDFDGVTTITDLSTGDRYLLGSLSAGTGFLLQAGYNPWSFAGFEVFGVRSRLPTGFDTGSNGFANLDFNLVGAHLAVYQERDLEIFVKMGIGTSDLHMPGSAFPAGSGVATGETFSGRASALGAGFQHFDRHFALGVGYTLYAATYDRVKADGGASYGLTNHLNLTTGALEATLTYYFGTNTEEERP